MAAASEPPPPRGFQSIACWVRSKNRSLMNASIGGMTTIGRRRPSLKMKRCVSTSCLMRAFCCSGSRPSTSRSGRPKSDGSADNPTFSNSDVGVASTTRSPSSSPPWIVRVASLRTIAM